MWELIKITHRVLPAVCGVLLLGVVLTGCLPGGGSTQPAFTDDQELFPGETEINQQELLLAPIKEPLSVQLQMQGEGGQVGTASIYGDHQSQTVISMNLVGVTVAGGVEVWRGSCGEPMERLFTLNALTDNTSQTTLETNFDAFKQLTREPTVPLVREVARQTIISCGLIQ